MKLLSGILYACRSAVMDLLIRWRACGPGQSGARPACNTPRSMRFWLTRVLLLLGFLGLVLLTFLTTGRGLVPPTQGRFARAVQTIPARPATVAMTRRVPSALLTFAATHPDAAKVPLRAAGGQSTAAGGPAHQEVEGTCKGNEPLHAADQLHYCDWTVIDVAQNGDEDVLYECNSSTTLSPDWGSNPLIYLCSGIVPNQPQDYCMVPASVKLSAITNIRCSDVLNGPLQPCFYTWTTIGKCDFPCKAQDAPTDPVTGIPLPTTATPTSKKSKTNTICPIEVPTKCTGSFDPANDWIFGSSQGLLFAGATNGTGSSTFDLSLVQNVWNLVAVVALALLAVPFLLAGYQIMRGASSENHAGAIELLGRILLMAAAVALSFFIASSLVKIEDGLAQDFSSHFQSTQATPGSPTGSPYISMPSSNWQCYTQQFFGTLFNMNVDTTNNSVTGNSNQTAFTSDMTRSTLILLENLPNYVLTLLSVLLAIQLVIRLALLNLHIVLSPLTIVCNALPGEFGPGAARHWAKGFVSLLFVQLLQLVVLILGSRLLPFTLVQPGTGDWVTQMFSALLPIAVMVITLNIPRLFNVPATTLLSTVTSSIGGAVNGISLIIRGL